MRRPKRGKRANEVGIDVAGEIADTARCDRPMVVEVAAIVVGDPPGIREDVEAVMDESTAELEIMGYLPGRRRVFPAEILKNTIVLVDHPVRGFFHVTPARFRHRSRTGR